MLEQLSTLGGLMVSLPMVVFPTPSESDNLVNLGNREVKGFPEKIVGKCMRK